MDDTRRTPIVVAVLVLCATGIAALSQSDGRDQAFGKSDLRRHVARVARPGISRPTPVRPHVPSPAAAVPTTPSTPYEPAPRPPVLRHIGETGVDEGLAFTVDSLTVATSVPREGYDNPPPLRGRFAVAKVTYVNHTGQPLDPFCGGNSARLVDGDGQGHDTVDSLFELAGNRSICSGADTRDGGSATVTLAFRLPRGATIQALELFNGKAGDFDGRDGLVRFLPG